MCLSLCDSSFKSRSLAPSLRGRQERTAIFVIWLMALYALVLTPLADARGTPAGTVITNEAHLNYSQGGVVGAVARSNTVQLTVHEVIDVSVQSLDAAGVATGSPDINVPLTFRVTNLGNALSSYRLDRVTPDRAGDFNPPPASVGAIFIENGLQPGFQATGPNADLRYISGVHDLSMAPDSSYTIYLVSDLQANLAEGHRGRSTLRATSNIAGAAGAAPGSLMTSVSSGGNGAVIGASSAVSQATGTYIVAGTRVVMTKTQVGVRAPDGGKSFIPGAQADYLIEILVLGTSGQITDFELVDPLPSNLRYVSNSLTINGTTKTDGLDTDEAHVVNEVLKVRLGTLLPGSRWLIAYSTRLQ
jgi:hypothetical protein